MNQASGKWKPAYDAIFLIGVMLISALLVRSVLAEWSAAQNLPGSVEDGMPSLVIDHTGIAHMLFLSFTTVEGKYPLLYTRGTLDATTQTIAWEPIQRIGLYTKKDFLPIVVDSSGTVHGLVIAPDGYLYHIWNPAQGAAGNWNSSVVIACNWSPDLAIDASGTLYAVCSRNVTGGVESIFLFRTPDGNWGGPINVSGAPVNLVRDNRITVAGGIVHLLFEWRETNKGSMTTQYSRGGVSGFTMNLFPQSVGRASGDHPRIAADPISGLLFATFVWGEVADNYYTALTVSGDSGNTWAPATDLLIKNRWWYDTRSLVASDQMAHFVSEQKAWDGSKTTGITIYYQAYQHGVGFSDGELLSTGNLSTQPAIAANQWGTLTAWVLGNTNGVYYRVGGPPGPLPPTRVPTSTPVPTDTPTPTHSPTPTATATPWGGVLAPMPPERHRGRIAFVSNRDGKHWNIFTMLADGGEVTQLTHDAGDNWDPAWSPDGTRIVFASNRDDPNNYNLYLMQANGSKVISFTNRIGTETHPAWMPDGSLIVFECAGANGDTDICSLPVSSPLAEPLTMINWSGNEKFPAISPDGKTLAFASDHFGNFDIFLVRLSNGELTQLTNHPAVDTQPAWSPDGQLIAFVSQRMDAGGGIFVVESHGNNDPVPLTGLNATPHTNGYPSWSSGGQYLIFHTNRDGNNEIYALSSNGANQANISMHAGEDGHGNWTIHLATPIATPTITPIPPTPTITPIPPTPIPSTPKKLYIPLVLTAKARG